ncbi:MAG TPA: tetratricopeptide repeat protein [Phycisphaerae bacterium]|nr:tetratricopeptide repeat protein [Phycisphaerae bacterium]
MGSRSPTSPVQDFAFVPSAGWSHSYLKAAAGLIIAATVIAYLPTLRGGFIWDDAAHVTRPGLRSAHGLYRIWFEVGATQQYYPLLHSAFWFEHKLWGDWPMGYHLVNIALHACAAVMVMRILRRLLMDKGIAWADEAAFLTAAVFALHPVHVESVAWITEQKNTLSGVLYLGSMAMYLRFDRTRDRRPYRLATAIFVLSLLAKPVTVTLPAALLVIFWWQRGRLSMRGDVLPLVPWFLLSLVSGLFTAWVEHDVIGAKEAGSNLLAVERILLPARVVWFYLSKLFWPAELIFVYPRWVVDPSVWWQWLFPMALIVLFIVLFPVSRKNRAPLAATLFFVGSLFPVLGFFNVYLYLYTFVADHFQYLPSLGIIALACGCAVAVLFRAPRPRFRAVALLVLPAVLGVLTFRQCRMYSDIEMLYATTIRKYPECWMAHNNLGVVLKDKGQYREAMAHYQTALRLRPEYPEAYNNLGVVYNAMGRYDEAIASYEEALRLRPHYPDALGNLIVPLTDGGRLDQALARSEEAVQAAPDDVRIRINYGIALLKAKRPWDAIEQFTTAVGLRPDLLETHWNLAVGYEAVGLVAEAVDSAGRAQELASSSGQVGRATKIAAWIEICRARAAGMVPGL